jgi:F-type H+-transporting ATPase subunit b
MIEPNATLIGQLLTFIVLVWFTMKYVWPPITKAIEEREKKIASGLEAAERGKRELEHAEHKALTIIRDAKVEASHVIDQAHRRSVQIVEEAKETARVESRRIVEHAQEEIARELSQTKEALRKQLAQLAVAGAEKIIQRNLDASAQIALLDEFAAEI